MQKNILNPIRQAALDKTQELLAEEYQNFFHRVHLSWCTQATLWKQENKKSKNKLAECGAIW